MASWEGRLCCYDVAMQWKLVVLDEVLMLLLDLTTCTVLVIDHHHLWAHHNLVEIDFAHGYRLWARGSSLQLLGLLNEVAPALVPKVADRRQHGWLVGHRRRRGHERLRTASNALRLDDLLELWDFNLTWTVFVVLLLLWLHPALIGSSDIRWFFLLLFLLSPLLATAITADERLGSFSSATMYFGLVRVVVGAYDDSACTLNPFFVTVRALVELIQLSVLIDALQLAHHAERAAMLLHLLVVAVETTDREISRCALWATNHDTFSAPVARRPHQNLLPSVLYELFVCVGTWLHNATPTTLINHECQRLVLPIFCIFVSLLLYPTAFALAFQLVFSVPIWSISDVSDQFICAPVDIFLWSMFQVFPPGLSVFWLSAVALDLLGLAGCFAFFHDLVRLNYWLLGLAGLMEWIISETGERRPWRLRRGDWLVLLHGCVILWRAASSHRWIFRIIKLLGLDVLFERLEFDLLIVSLAVFHGMAQRYFLAVSSTISEFLSISIIAYLTILMLHFLTLFFFLLLLDDHLWLQKILPYHVTATLDFVHGSVPWFSDRLSVHEITILIIVGIFVTLVNRIVQAIGLRSIGHWIIVHSVTTGATGALHYGWVSNFKLSLSHWQ